MALGEERKGAPSVVSFQRLFHHYNVTLLCTRDAENTDIREYCVFLKYIRYRFGQISLYCYIIQ